MLYRAGGAVPCCTVLAVLCRAVPCCAVLSFEHTPVPGIANAGTRYTGMYVCVLAFLLCSLIVLLLGPFRVFFSRKLHPYCRSERDIANKHPEQHRQGNQLYTSSSWHYQIVSCTKSWASSFCPLHITLKSFLRERSGQRQPPAERSPWISYENV